MRRAALSGWRGAVPTVLGLEAGLFLWALAAAGGFAALVAAVRRSPSRCCGWSAPRSCSSSGTRALVGAWRRRAGDDDGAPAVDPVALAGRRGWARAFGEGAAVQLANPKAAVLMLALYPQFVPPDRPLFVTTSLLALLQVTIETGLYLALAAGVGRRATGSAGRSSAGAPTCSWAPCWWGWVSASPPPGADHARSVTPGGGRWPSG